MLIIAANSKPRHVPLTLISSLTVVRLNLEFSSVKQLWMHSACRYVLVMNEPSEKDEGKSWRREWFGWSRVCVINIAFSFVLCFKLSSDSLVSQLAIVQLLRFIITAISGLTQFPTCWENNLPYTIFLTIVPSTCLNGFHVTREITRWIQIGWISG